MGGSGVTARESGSGNKKWLKISVQAPVALMEPVSDLMGVISGSGVEMTPEESGSSRISGFFPGPDNEDARNALAEDVYQKMKELFGFYDLPAPELHTETFADQDWATSWKQFFTPVEVAPGLIIKPSWEEYRATGKERVIEMDPGQAFGTGLHASTRMALALLTKSLSDHPASRMLDVGTGTGILAMAAALFGVPSVVAVDNDPEAVRVAGENIVNNDLAAAIEVGGRDISDLDGSFSIIAANIVHNVLVSIAPDIQKRCASRGRVILAGILGGEQEENIIRVYAQLGMQPAASLHEEEWAALLLEQELK